VLEQVVIAIAGRFEVELDDGTSTARYELGHPSEGLYVRPMIWGRIHNFSPGAVCLVLASDVYDESDYYREYSHFKAAVEARR
jgi:hypothetical protein